MNVRKDYELSQLVDYGFIYNPNHREYMTTLPRYEYYENGVKKGNTKPLVIVQNDGYRVIQMVFTSTYIRREIPDVVYDMIKDGVIETINNTEPLNTTYYIRYTTLSGDSCNSATECFKNKNEAFKRYYELINDYRYCNESVGALSLETDDETLSEWEYEDEDNNYLDTSFDNEDFLMWGKEQLRYLKNKQKVCTLDYDEEEMISVMEEDFGY